MKIVIISLLSVLQMSFVIGQNTAVNHGEACVSSEINNPNVDPSHELAIELNKIEDSIRINGFVEAKSQCGLIIPVVFHIVDQNPYKVTDGQIASAMAILNEDFNKLNSEIGSLDTDFEPLAADINIEFKLALIDPFGNVTNGIDRVVSDGICNNTNGGGDVSVNCPVKIVAPAWNTDMYLNIWIINDVYGGTTNTTTTSGWAFRAESVPYLSSGEDGIVYNHRYLGTEGSSDAATFLGDMKRTLTHEVGHYLNLKHTFTGYCSSGIDDEVSDTPKIKYNNCGVSNGTGCCPYAGADPIYWKSCDGVTTVNYENYMDYSRCPSMFTIGQKVRMLAALQSSVRSNLTSLSNLEATGLCASSVGIQNINNNIISVYPNPFSSQFTIKLNSINQESSIVVFDLVGNIVFEQSNLISNEININLKNQPSGQYVVQFISSEGVTNLKIIKK